MDDAQSESEGAHAVMPHGGSRMASRRTEGIDLACTLIPLGGTNASEAHRLERRPGDEVGGLRVLHVAVAPATRATQVEMYGIVRIEWRNAVG